MRTVFPASGDVNAVVPAPGPASPQSAQGEARPDRGVIGGGLLPAIGRVLGDRGRLNRAGVGLLDAVDEHMADQEVVDQLAASAKAAAEAALLGDQWSDDQAFAFIRSRTP